MRLIQADIKDPGSGGSPIAFERSQPPQTLYFQALGRCRGAIQISAPGHSGYIILWHGDLYTDRPAHASFFSITQRFPNSRISWGSPAPVSPVMFPFSILFYLLLFIQMQRASSGRTNEQILAAWVLNIESWMVFRGNICACDWSGFLALAVDKCADVGALVPVRNPGYCPTKAIGKLAGKRRKVRYFLY